MHRTDNHVTRYRCNDVKSSWIRGRDKLIAEAKSANAKIISDDGTHFYAESFDCCGSRLVFHAGEIGAPYMNGPCISRIKANGEYVDLFLPK